MLRELLATHAGLEFLQSTPEFQDRYGLFYLYQSTFQIYLSSDATFSNFLRFGLVNCAQSCKKAQISKNLLFSPINFPIISQEFNLFFMLFSFSLFCDVNFNLRYYHWPAETVIYRIFYYVNRAGNGHLTLRELKRGNLIDAMQHADEEEDINKVLRLTFWMSTYLGLL